MTKGPQLDRRGLFAAGLCTALAAALPSAHAAGRVAPFRWLGAWGPALIPARDAAALAPGSRYGQKLVSSIGGTDGRLRLTHAYADAALTVAGLNIRIGERTIPLRFSGADRIDIPVGASVLSDPVPLKIEAGAELEIEFTLPAGGKLTAIERTADRKGAWVESAGTRRDTSPALIHELQIRAGDRPVLGILSDTKSAGPGTWPEEFARLTKGRVGMVNRSVFGGHLALGPADASALSRFDRDVLGTAGVSHVLIFTGNNDLIQPGMIGSGGRPSLDPALMQTGPQLIGLLAQAVERTRVAGMVAIGGTWLPYEGVTQAQGYSTPEKLALREEVNRWIRKPGSFDRVVDFDRALRDPAHPARLASAYDNGNRFTPNAAGYAAMARAMLPIIS